ncbi:cupin domain-containing protein [Laceyella tengchongensis]
MSVVEIKNKLTGEKGMVRSKVLDFEQGVVVNLQLKAGKKIPRHHANCHVLVFVVSGEVWFGVGEQKFHLKTGSLLHMNPFEEHDIEAIQDSNLLVFKVGSQSSCNLKV